jgi:hypothetical protein
MDKFNKDGHPPSYPQPAHHDAGPYYGPGSPPPQNFSPAPGQNMYGVPQQNNQYGPPPGAGQDYYGSGPPPQQGGYYGGGPGPQQGMNYGPPMQGQGGPGQYQGRKPGGIGKGGLCAGIISALCCCCFLDAMF